MSTRAGSNRKTLGKLEVAREKPGTVDFNPLSWKCSSSAPLFFFFFCFCHKVIPFFPVDFPAFPRLDAFVILFGVSCCVFLIAFFLHFAMHFAYVLPIPSASLGVYGVGGLFMGPRQTAPA